MDDISTTNFVVNRELSSRRQTEYLREIGDQVEEKIKTFSGVKRIARKG